MMNTYTRLDIMLVAVMLYTLLLLCGARAADECVTNGTLSTTDLWHGYLFQHTFHANPSTFKYHISYPASQCCVNLLLYFDDQVNEINNTMTCEQREAILSPENNQIISLQLQNVFGGCETTNNTGVEMLTCTKEFSFQSIHPRTWHAALSRCNSNNDSLTIEYFFNVTNVVGACDSHTTNTTPMMNDQTTTSNAVRGPSYCTVMLIVCIMLLMVKSI